jgi:pyruvate dehydrogenase E2 component (dihydrolipoamide acetyltransferase)
MSYLIKMPQMGLEMEQGEVVAWEVDVDEVVEEGDVVALVESEKATNEVEAREEGAVRRILCSEGETAEPGDPIGIFAPPDEDISDLLEGVDGETTPTEAESSADTSTAEDNQSRSNAGEAVSQTDAQAVTEIRATPGARTLAEKREIEISTVTGTGPQGTITESDVKAETTADETGPEGASDTADVRATPGARRLADAEQIDIESVEGTGPEGVVIEDDVEAASAENNETATYMTPGARRVAKAEGVDIQRVSGSGPEGVVTQEDVEAYLSTANTEGGTDGASSTTGEETTAIRTVREVRSRSGVQQTVANRMESSHRSAPHVTLKREIDTTALQAVETAAAAEDVDISVTDLLLCGFGAQLAAQPAFNALFEEGEHKLINEVNIGVAVDIEDGLVTPVVPSVNKKSVEAIAAVRGERTDRALSGDFRMSDMEGGTFTITNLGMLGVDSFDPIINPPEVAILGVGRLRDDGTMTLSLSFDHRVVNGADAARFLDSAVGYLTNARWLAEQFDADIVGALIDHLME